jgi:uncharacterized membrane protein AbrB (regulator of aidB expression)
MCITAKALQVGAPTMTAVHVMRVVILVMTTALAFRLVRRSWHAARRSAQT